MMMMMMMMIIAIACHPHTSSRRGAPIGHSCLRGTSKCLIWRVDGDDDDADDADDADDDDDADNVQGHI